MNNKKDFGLFIKSKRTEKSLSQKELADILFVTESAVSKWERGLSYPDITMVANLCKTLEISEHELITASTDHAYRKEKAEAKNFRTIKSAWFLIPTICYAIALVTCFICNLAVNHTLSWFWTVLASLICSYAFVPTFSMFFNKYKLLIFLTTSFSALALLLLVCGMLYGNILAYITAILGILIGYVLVFIPICIEKYNTSTIIKKLKFLISIVLAGLITILMMCVIRVYYNYRLLNAILICLYCFAALIICALLGLTKQNKLLKASEIVFTLTTFFYLTNLVVSKVLRIPNDSYNIDFSNWKTCVNGNCNFIVFLSFLFIGLVLLIVGFLRINNKEKSNKKH